MARLRPLLALAGVAALLGGCQAPSVDVPDGGSVEQEPFAELVLFYSPGGEPADPSEAAPVLGAPDGVGVELGVGGQLEVLFPSGPILNAEGSDDVRIHGTFADGTMVLVELSLDGQSYRSLPDFVTAADAAVDLDDAVLSAATYVRLTDLGAGGAVIDAIEAISAGDGADGGGS